MWSCRLNKIKSGRTRMSITNSRQLAEVQDAQSLTSSMAKPNISYLFSKIAMAPFVGTICWGNLFGHAVGFGRGTVLVKPGVWACAGLYAVHQLGFVVFCCADAIWTKKLQNLSLGYDFIVGLFSITDHCVGDHAQP